MQRLEGVSHTFIVLTFNFHLVYNSRTLVIDFSGPHLIR